MVGLFLTTSRIIQGLGTLRLLNDIDQNKVLEGFEFTHFKTLEEADDKGEFYKVMQKDSNDEVEFKNKIVEFMYNTAKIVRKNLL